MITPEEVKRRAIQLLGERSVVRTLGKWFVVFDKHSPDVQILPDFNLHRLLTKNDIQSHTRLDIKILADLQNIYEEFDEEIDVLETFTYPYQDQVAYEDPVHEEFHQIGAAIDIKPRRRGHMIMRELHKATRRAKKSGGAHLFKDYIHIDSMYTWKTKERG